MSQISIKIKKRERDRPNFTVLKKMVFKVEILSQTRHEVRMELRAAYVLFG